MFYTVKEISEICNVSKPTVQKVINENGISPDLILKNKYRYYSKDKTVLIIKYVNPLFDTEKLPQSTENEPPIIENEPQTDEKEPKRTENEPQTTENREENNSVSDEIKLMRDMLSIIQEQLKQKDDELRKKDLEIQDYKDKLDNAYKEISLMGQKAQYITMADKAERIQQREEETIAIEPDVIPQSKSLWEKFKELWK